jgi:type III pantothenate kinase
MLLAIDVGNTNITLGLFQEKRLVKELRTETGDFKHLPELPWPKIERAIIASVVPRIDPLLRRQIKKPCYFVTPERLPGIKAKVKSKREVGADRLVNAVAARSIFGGPLIVVDFGTATTFCAVTAAGEYLGGAIAPGINLSRLILHERTAKLPLITLHKPKKVIGNSTKEAMSSGLVWGYGHMVAGLIQAMKKELANKYGQKNIKVVATGGYARLINEVLQEKIEHIDQQLTLKGLRMIAESVF